MAASSGWSSRPTTRLATYSPSVERSRASIEKTLADYYIFEIDGNPVACVALHVEPDGRKAELACLFVNPSHEH